MPKRFSAAADHSGKLTAAAKGLIIKYYRSALLMMLCLTLAGAVVIGYGLGNNKSVQAVAPARHDSALSQRLEDQKSLCETVDKIDLEQKLDQERYLNDVLNQSMDANLAAIEQQKTELEHQKTELEHQKTEMADLETRILSALMSNFSEKLISRSNGSVDSYVKETENLLDLSKRLNQFSSSEDAKEVDLTDYKQALDSRLLRVPTLWPVKGRISSGFGYRIHPIYKYRHLHPGLDIVAAKGNNIRATATGYVSEAGYNSSMGNYIKISHGNGFTTVFMHCQKLKVSSGQTVEKGQTIATVGSTGTSTGPHLHYEIHLHGTPVNPSRFIME